MKRFIPLLALLSIIPAVAACGGEATFIPELTPLHPLP